MRSTFGILLSNAALVLSGVCLQVAAADLPPRTALDDYVGRPDDSFSWRIVATSVADGVETIVVDMVSQNWLTEAEVDRTEWRHWVVISVPADVTSDVGMLYIGGGRNGGEPPSGPNARTTAIVKATGTVVAELGMVPNQPLVFRGDGKPRTEDDLIAYTWDRFLETGDPRWPARNAMIKSAVRAMDTVTEVMAAREAGAHEVDRFVVAGGSKRGWTTWLTGALDERVIGLVPIVIDVLNADVSMRHHFAAYGFWAPSVGDYVAHDIMRRMDHPRLQALYALVDPYYYRHRLTMPKLVLNAAGDQFFLPDSSRFYFDELRGESYLRYVPNADHGLGKSDALESLIAFYALIVRGKKPPQYAWTVAEDGSLSVLARERPREVRLWQASNPEARDFRVETLGRAYTSTVVPPSEPGLYVAKAPTPERGWTAFFLELTYDVGVAAPLKLTTEVVVTPDTLPFDGKPVDLRTSVTLTCRATSAAAASRIGSNAAAIEAEGFAADGLALRVRSQRVYLNWTPVGDLDAGVAAVRDHLEGEECDFAYQLESGPQMTLPPL